MKNIENPISIKKHWFARHESTKNRVDFCKKLEQFNYDSILIPFSYEFGDPFIKTCILLNETNKLNYLIAFPPYLISPEYCSMIIKSINEAYPNRNIMLNIVNTLERTKNNIFKINKTQEEVRLLSGDFSKKLKDNIECSISFSGNSDITIKNVLLIGEMQISEFEKINNKQIEEIKNGGKRIMVRVFIVARETKKDAIEWYNDTLKKMKDDNDDLIFIDRVMKNSIIGSYEEVKDVILNLEKIGITDLLVSDIHWTNDEENVHKALEFIQ